MHTDLVLDALEMTTWRRQVGNGCMYRFDAGSQYTSICYTDRLIVAGLAASIGTIGDSHSMDYGEHVANSNSQS